MFHFFLYELTADVHSASYGFKNYRQDQSRKTQGKRHGIKLKAKKQCRQ
jgi:hypothetical protein